MMKSTILRTAALMALSTSALAHDAWLERSDSPTVFTVRFGEDRPEPFAPQKLTELRAIDAAGASVNVTLAPSSAAKVDGVRATLAGPAALLALTYDNGYYSRIGQAKQVPLPMDRNPGATSGQHALKAHKYVLEWTPVVTQPVGHLLEIVPLQASPPMAGTPMTVRLLLDGRPLANTKVSPGEEADGPRTDASGQVSVTPRHGHNILWSGVRRPVKGDPKTDTESLQVSLHFDIR